MGTPFEIEKECTHRSVLGYRIISTILASLQKVSEFADNERVSIESLIHIHRPQNTYAPVRRFESSARRPNQTPHFCRII